MSPQFFAILHGHHVRMGGKQVGLEIFLCAFYSIKNAKVVDYFDLNELVALKLLKLYNKQRKIEPK